LIRRLFPRPDERVNAQIMKQYMYLSARNWCVFTVKVTCVAADRYLRQWKSGATEFHEWANLSSHVFIVFVVLDENIPMCTKKL